MTALIVALSLLLLAIGVGVAATRDPLHQTLAGGFFALVLALLFLVFQAPDVALSEIVIGSIALPTITLLTLAKIVELARRQRQLEGSDAEGGEEDS